MDTVRLRNTNRFPTYRLSESLAETCSDTLIRSNKRTGDEVVTVWENATDHELVMLWLWHNSEVREIYRLRAHTITIASLLDGMGIAVMCEQRGCCLYSDVITLASSSGVLARFR
jgi:hypothetical protein